MTQLLDDLRALDALFSLMDEADDALDRDTYEQNRKSEFDAPDDAEWWIRAGTARRCDKVFAEIDRIRRAIATEEGRVA
jgi:hypothetical protein